MALFNEFNSLFGQCAKGKATIEADDEAKLKDALMKILSKSRDLNYSHRDLSASLFLINIYELMQASKDGRCIWACVEIVKKATEHEENRTYLVKKMNFLPVLANILPICSDKNEQKSLLILIQDLCLKNKIKSGEGFVTNFLSHLVSIIVADEEDDLGRCALSVLIQMCHKNMFISQVLKNKTPIDDLRKKLTVERYGILACKMNLVLNDIGHVLNETDVRNFLNFINNEIPNAINKLDENAINQLTSFVEEIVDIEQAKITFISHSLDPIVKSIQKFLSKLPKISQNEEFSFLKLIYKLITVIVASKNQSFQPLYKDFIHSAMEYIQLRTSSLEPVQMIRKILSIEKNIPNFEPESLVQTTRKILLDPVACPKTTIVALQLVLLLSNQYDVEILTESYVESIMKPLSAENIKYMSIPSETITMYLQCLYTATIVLKTVEISPYFEKVNVKYIVAMSMKHGDEEQVGLALDLIEQKFIPNKYLAKIIVDLPRDENELLPYAETTLNTTTMINHHTLPLANSTQIDKTTKDEVLTTIKSIDKANKENKLHQQNVSEFLKVYDAQIAILKQKNTAQKHQINELMRQITALTQTESINMNVMTNYAELTKSLQSSVEQLQVESVRKQHAIELNNKMVQKSAEHVKEMKQDIEKLKRKIKDSESKVKEKEQRISDLEKELESEEQTRNTILHLMAKRKK